MGESEFTRLIVPTSSILHLQYLMRILLLLSASLLLPSVSFAAPAAAHPVPSIQDTETKAQRDVRMAWWRDARFGMFIHWGLYAQKFSGADAEWSMHNAKIPVATYKALADMFNPTKFNADAWVALAKNAGMKYMVFTTKHHDGFAMYDSKVDPFNIVDATPFKRDPLKELAAACNRQGMKLGFYYSQDQDWTAPGGAAYGGHWDPAQKGSFADYLEKKSIPQIEELLANYQPYPSNIWFDYPTSDMTPELASKIVTILNKYPNLIWNDRLGGGYHGDTETHEENIPPQGFPGRDWETCMTINGHWGYNPQDHNFKSAETLLRNLIDIASKGGNYLLNVGPDASGVIPQPEVDRLTEMGKWLAVNGEAIYGTRATPFPDPHGSYDPTKLDAEGKPTWVPKWDWRCTTKPGKIFVHIFQWPGTTFTLSGVKNEVTGAHMLSDAGTELPIAQSGENLEVTLPAHAPDPIASVLVLEVKDSTISPGH
jgi:alpha-L-fucosidase